MRQTSILTNFLLSLALLTACEALPTGTQPGEPASVTTAASVSSRPETLPGTLPASVPAASTTPVLPAEPTFPAGTSVLRGLLGTITTLDPRDMSLTSEAELFRYLCGSLYTLTGDPVTGRAIPVPFHAQAKPVGLGGTLVTPGSTVSGTGTMAEPGESRYTRFAIELRPGLTFSDGSPVEAGDYVAALERLLEPGTRSLTASVFLVDLPLVGAEAFHTGKAPFSQVGFQAISPSRLELAISEPRTAEEIMEDLTLPFLVKGNPGEGTDPAGLVAAGPYQIRDFVPGESLVLTRRPAAGLDELSGALYSWDHLWLRRYSSRLDMLEAFYAGDLDIVPVSGTALRQLQTDPRLVEVESNTVWGIHVNGGGDHGSILTDPDLRQTLYWGTDRSPIAVGLFGSYSSYSGFIGPLSRVTKNGATVTWRRTSESQANAASANVYDPKRAAGHATLALDRLGEAAVTLELAIPADDRQMQAMAELLTRQWEELLAPRITFRIRSLPVAELYERMRTGEYELAFGALSQDPADPWEAMAVYRAGHPAGGGHQVSQAFAELYAQSQSEALRNDPAARLKLLAALEGLLLQELPQIPLFVDHGAWLVNEDLELAFARGIPGFGLALDQARRSGTN